MYNQINKQFTPQTKLSQNQSMSLAIKTKTTIQFSRFKDNISMKGRKDNSDNPNNQEIKIRWFHIKITYPSHRIKHFIQKQIYHAIISNNIFQKYQMFRMKR